MRSNISDKHEHILSSLERLKEGRGKLLIDVRYSTRTYEHRRKQDIITLINNNNLRKLAVIKRLSAKVNESYAALTAANSNAARTEEKGKVKESREHVSAIDEETSQCHGAVNASYRLLVKVHNFVQYLNNTTMTNRTV